MTFPHHDSAAFLEVAKVNGHWYVRQTCPCHKGTRVSVPFLTCNEAVRCLVAMDEVSASLVAKPLSAPGGRATWTISRCARGDLRQRRRALGLTCQELARRLGVHRSTISEAERRGGPSPALIRRLEAALATAERRASPPPIQT